MCTSVHGEVVCVLVYMVRISKVVLYLVRAYSVVM